MGGRRRAGVLGSPISHSLSPVLHRAAYAELGLDWAYDAHEVDEGTLPGFLTGLDARWAGLSLTMPLKRAVLPLLASVTPLVRAVGAANTVLPLPAPGPAPGPADVRALQWHGENTDVPGLVAALRAASAEPLAQQARSAGPARAAVLGAGATACSALAALRELGVVEPVVLARDPTRTGELTAAARRLGVSPRLAPWGTPPPVDVVVVTTPAGAADGLAARLPGRVSGLLIDVVYAPWPTPLARAWQAGGGAVVGGFELLLQQAARQVELMTGLPAPVAAMRAAGKAALREDHE